MYAPDADKWPILRLARLPDMEVVLEEGVVGMGDGLVVGIRSSEEQRGLGLDVLLSVSVSVLSVKITRRDHVVKMWTFGDLLCATYLLVRYVTDLSLRKLEFAAEI